MNTFHRPEISRILADDGTTWLYIADNLTPESPHGTLTDVITNRPMKISDYPEVKAEIPQVKALRTASYNAAVSIESLTAQLERQTAANDWQANQLKAERHNAGVLAQNLGAVTKERDELIIKLTGLENQHNHLSRHCEHLRGEVEELNTTVRNVKACNDRQTKLIVELQKQGADLIAADQCVKAAANNRVTATEVNEVNAWKSRTAYWEDRAQHAESTLAKLQAKVDALTS